MTVVVQLPRLPPPGGSTQEVLFRRMLLQCSQRLAQHSPDQPGSKDWRTDAKFHCILEALQERLYDLEHAGPEVRPGPDVLAQYQEAVRAITSQLQAPQLPSYCLRVSAQDNRPAGRAANGLAAAAMQRDSSSGQQAAQRLSGEQQQRSGTARAPGEAAAAAAAAGRAAAGRPGNTAAGAQSAATAAADNPKFSLSSGTQQALTTQQRLQDELTDELLGMGAELRSSTLAMQNAIRHRGTLLDQTETNLVHSAENAKAVAAKAKQQYRQGNWNLCHTCIIVLLVSTIFTFMIVAIRVSSFVGLKGSRR